MHTYAQRFSICFCLLLASAFASSPVLAQRGTVPVNVESTPAGATVRLDDATAAPLGVTPLRRVRLPRGEHVLHFELAGHRRAEQRVNVRRRNETFRQTLDALGTITVLAGNADARGAAVRIDGESLGNVPTTREVAPGRHMIQVGREGFLTFSDWVEVAGGQVLTLPVALEREAPRTGSVLIAADLSGAPIFVDGEQRGSTPSVVEGLSEGEHLVEVRPEGSDVDAARRTVSIRAGERAVLSLTLRRAPPPGGTLRVLVTPQAANAVVFLDGDTLGQAPVSRGEIAEGEHIVEVRAEGFQPLQRPVRIEAGQARVISLELAEIARAPGRIVVRSQTPNATVTIDGEERGSAPVVIETPAAGVHAVVVTADGYRDERRTCETAPGRPCELDLELRPVGVVVRVTANVGGARLFVDDEDVGPVPFEGEVPAGSHVIEVRAEGYQPHRVTAMVAANRELAPIEAVLVREGELSAEERQAYAEERTRIRREATVRSGQTLPDDIALVDFSVGWPHLLEGRIGIGIFDWLEAGVGARTFGRLTEFEGRVKAGWRPVRQFSFGAQLRFGGGIGPTRNATRLERERAEAIGEDAQPHPTNSFCSSIEGLLSLHFARAGDFTLWAGVDLTSDRWDWSAADSNCRYATGCEAGGVGRPDDQGRVRVIRDRQNLARFRLGGSLEFVVTRKWNVWGSFEGAFGSPRRILGDVFGAGNEDLQLYGRLGATYKFDVARD